MDQNLQSLSEAIDDFHKARSQAALKEILARITGESTQLLSFDELRQKLKVKGSFERGLRDIPLDAIIGSVGRYNDFTRDFLPKQDMDETRWALNHWQNLNRVFASSYNAALVPSWRHLRQCHP